MLSSVCRAAPKRFASVARCLRFRVFFDFALFTSAISSSEETAPSLSDPPSSEAASCSETLRASEGALSFASESASVAGDATFLRFVGGMLYGLGGEREKEERSKSCRKMIDSQQLYHRRPLPDPCTGLTTNHSDSRDVLRAASPIRQQPTVSLIWCTQGSIRCKLTRGKLCGRPESTHPIYTLLPGLRAHSCW